MASRFNQIFEKEQYVPMVQPLPYEALAGLGESFQKENDQLTDANFKLQELMKKIQVDPYDTPYKKQFDDEYYKILSPISEKIAKGDPSARRDLMEAQSKFNMDQRLNTFAHNYQMGKTAREDYHKLQNEGKTSRYGWSNTFDEAARARKQLEPFNYQGHNPWFDPYKDAENIVGGINDTQLRNGMKNFSMGPNGKLILTGNSGVTGINQKKLEQVANASLESFINSNGGRSYIRDLQAQGITDEKELLKRSYEYLIDVSTKQLGVKGGDPILDSVGDHYNIEVDSNGQKLFLPSKTLPATIAEQYKIDKSGFVKKVFNVFKNWLNPLSAPNVPNVDKNADLNTPQNKKLLEKAANYYGENLGSWASDDEKIELINRYVEDWGKQMVYEPVGVRGDLKTLKAEDELMFERQQYASRDFIDMETGETLRGDKLGKEFMDAEGKSNSLVYGPDNPYGLPSANIVTVTKSDGTVKQYLAKPAEGGYTADEVIRNQMYSAKYNPLGESKVTLPAEKNGKPTTVEYTIKYEPTYNNSTLNSKGQGIRTGESVMLLDEKGNPVLKEPIQVGPGQDAIDVLYKTLTQ